MSVVGTFKFALNYLELVDRGIKFFVDGVELKELNDVIEADNQHKTIVLVNKEGKIYDSETKTWKEP